MDIKTKEFLNKVKAIHGNKYKPVDAYTGCSVKMNVWCSKCKDTWNTTPNSLLSGYGCHSCARSAQKKKVTKPRINATEFSKRLKLANPKIKLLEEFHRIASYIKVKCLRCNHEWSARADNLQSGKGCSKCNTTRITKEVFVKRLKAKHPNITVTGFIEQEADAIFKCNTCKNIETRRAYSVLLSKHGCNYCATEASAAATGYKRKRLRIQGKHFVLQGFEPAAIKWILSEKNINADQIKHGKEVPRFKYTRLKKKHVYIPDLLYRNRVIEVKSDYTLVGQKDWFEIVVAKRQAVIDAGYKFTLLCFNKQEKKISLPKDWWTLTHRQIVKELSSS